MQLAVLPDQVNEYILSNASLLCDLRKLIDNKRRLLAVEAADILEIKVDDLKTGFLRALDNLCVLSEVDPSIGRAAFDEAMQNFSTNSINHDFNGPKIN